MFVFVLVVVLLGFRLDTSSSFFSSAGRHPVFENRETVSYCTFALGYESWKETRLVVRAGVGVGVGFGVGGVRSARAANCCVATDCMDRDILNDCKLRICRLYILA